MRPSFLPLGFLLCLAAIAHAQSAAPAIDLFAGKDFAGWTVVTAEKTDIRSICAPSGDGIVAVAGKPTGYLLTDGTYENYSLTLEYRWPADAAPRANSGVLVHVASAPVAPSAWPTCIQVQTKSGYAGELLQMFGSTFAEPITIPAKGTTPPIRSKQAASSEFPHGEWNTLKILCRRGTIEVKVNGVLQNHVTQVEPHAGRIGIQLEGSAFELRNVHLTPLSAE